VSRLGDPPLCRNHEATISPIGTLATSGSDALHNCPEDASAPALPGHSPPSPSSDRGTEKPALAGSETRSRRPARTAGSRMIARCSQPSWIQRAPQPSHHALDRGLTTTTTWNDPQTGHCGIATSLAPRFVGREGLVTAGRHRSVALREPPGGCLLLIIIAGHCLAARVCQHLRESCTAGPRGGAEAIVGRVPRPAGKLAPRVSASGTLSLVRNSAGILPPGTADAPPEPQQTVGLEQASNDATEALAAEGRERGRAG